MNITELQIKNSFSDVTIKRGYQYFKKGNVKQIVNPKNFDDYQAFVKNATGSRYLVILIPDDDNHLQSFCTCPVRVECKHGVAFAYYLLNKNNETKKENNNVIPLFKSKVEPSQFDNWLTASKRIMGENIQEFNDAKWSLEDHLFYQLSPTSDNHLQVEIYKRKYLKSGKLNKGRKLSLNTLSSLQNGYHYDELPPDDDDIVSNMSFSWHPNGSHYKLDGESGRALMMEMLSSARCFWKDFFTEALTFNNMPRAVTFTWSGNKYFQLTCGMDFKDNSQIINNSPVIYFDQAKNKIGYIDSLFSYSLLLQLKNLPKLNKEEAIKFILWMSDKGFTLPMPKGVNIKRLEHPFQPKLLIQHDGKQFYARYQLVYGVVTTDYGEYPNQVETVIELAGETIIWKRDIVKEAQAETYLLEQAKFTVHSASLIDFADKQIQALHNSHYFWARFDPDFQKGLLDQGWLIEVDTDQPFPEMIHVENVEGHIESDEYSNWFELGLSIDINGKKVDLVPLLLGALDGIDDWNKLPENIIIPHHHDFLSIQREHLLPIIRILQQLTDDKGRIAKHHASVLNDIPFVNEWSGDKKIREIADKLADFDGLEKIAPPIGLKAKLRDYQQHGLEWINFLQEYGFAGILADDMGLGKTVQALAMMQRLYENKQLYKPILVVCPTSLVGNWRNEAAKFTPDLNVLILYGSDRKKEFCKIADKHLIITTYPLIHRDADLHKDTYYQWLILDEAQVIKNPSAKMTQSVKQIKAQHKLCLTGTPMENHLGELWSLFDFLMPGYLSNHKGFNDLYRKPIENGELYAQQWLNKRITPFLLRRTKDVVATELPAKTEIIQTLELPKQQRVLYETIRVSMEKKVRDLLKNKGMAKSQIEFLDALLKLRQACCHPKLVKLDEAKKVNESAKLSFLLEVLPEMLEEGRKVLIFSQFTSMLAIIEVALKKIKIKTTKLTGQTRKREEAINEFTSGNVNVFLISLKAGGVGLNLTEADTVIHFDPWWNPAAENQATDRAHRIGQNKPVFVYKLVTENTIEERVLELQKSKQAMADSVYGNKAQKEQASLSKMGSEQLLSLFE